MTSEKESVAFSTQKSSLGSSSHSDADSGTSSVSGVWKSAGLMGLATFFSRILGLVREQVFAVLFGASDQTDAFNVAFRIPNLLRDLFAEGAMSASFVPTFTATQVEEGRERAWRVAGLVFRVLFGVVSVLTLLGILFAPQLVEMYAAAFHQVPGKFELTVQLTRLLFPFFPAVALAAAFMGILNACGVFFLPAFSSALFNLTSITVGLLGVWLCGLFGPDNRFAIQPIHAMALGVLAGGTVQALCQLPALYRQGYRWQPRRPSDPPVWSDPRLRTMLWMMVPGTLGLAATQINLLVNTILATSQGPGAVSWLNYAFRLMQFPIGLFGVSLAAATLPRVSRAWVSGQIQESSEILSRSLNSVFAVNLPASAGLAFLGEPIIELIFQYGRFGVQDTRSAALALAMYSIGLASYSGVKVLVPACYAFGNTRLPVISSVVVVFLTIGLNRAMVGPFGFWGLALGTSLAATVNFCFLLFGVRSVLRDRGAMFQMRPLVIRFFSYLGVSLVMGVVCALSNQLWMQWLPEATWGGGGLGAGHLAVVLGRCLRLSVLIAEGVGVVLLLSHAFCLTEVQEVFELFKSKLKKKLRPQST